MCQDISCLETKQVCARFLKKKKMEVKLNETPKKRGGFSQTQHYRSSYKLLDDIDLTAYSYDFPKALLDSEVLRETKRSG